MARISRFKLKEEDMEKIYQIFFEVISKGNSKDTFRQIIDDILTDEEQIMIAKRVTIFYLLEWNVSQIDVANKLHMSTATINHYSKLWKHTSLQTKRIISGLKKIRHIQNIFADLISDILIQPGIKKGHWSLYWEDQQQRAKNKTGGF